MMDNKEADKLWREVLGIVQGMKVIKLKPDRFWLGFFCAVYFIAGVLLIIAGLLWTFGGGNG